MLDDKYGTHGTETRYEFDEQSLDTVPSSLNSKFTKSLTRFAYRNPNGITCGYATFDLLLQNSSITKRCFVILVFYRTLYAP